MSFTEQLGEWYPLLQHCFDQEWMKRLGRRLGAATEIQPSLDRVFRAFTLCPPSKLKVVIIGQDPYIRGEADGLAFSSNHTYTPSLQILLQEIKRTEPAGHESTRLEDWAEQGILLLNSVLTTKFGVSGAHKGWGWEYFIQEVLQVVKTFPQPIVFMLWGSDAKAVAHRYVYDSKKRFILTAPHPQAQNYNSNVHFVGCKHFWLANRFLVINKVDPIWWPDTDKMTEDNYKALLRSLINDYDYAGTMYREKLYMSPQMDANWRKDERTRLGHSEVADDLPF